MKERENIFLASNIKYLRNINNITQEKLGEVCGKKNTAISNYEAGDREPDITDIAKIANFFHISVDDLMLKDLRFDENERKEVTLSKEDELKLLTETLKRKGFLNENEQMTEETFNMLIDFAKANKQFIMKDDK